MINGITGFVRLKAWWLVLSALLLCGNTASAGGEKIKTKDWAPLSINGAESWPDTCQHLREWGAIPPGDDTIFARLQYDTLRLYIERCAMDKISWGYFNKINGAVQFMSNDTNRFEVYRAWLISVLYLNTIQEQYFCACMNSISTTFQAGKYFLLGRLAVKNYLRTYHRECWSSGDDEAYAKDSAYDVNAGYDPTHLPLLDSIGLGFLLKSAVNSPTTPFPLTYLASFTSSPNPFKDETRLRFHLNWLVYITIEIVDVLGRVVWESNGRSYDEGDHEIGIDGKLLPDGTLYARISTGFGEVKTVKLIKE